MNRQNLLYKLSKILGYENTASLRILATNILEKKNMKIPDNIDQRTANRIVSEYMKEIGLIFSRKMKINNATNHIVYFIQQDGGDMFIKIGKTNNINRRLTELQTGSPYKLNIIVKIFAENNSHANAIEKMLHERLGKFKSTGEWFTADALKYVNQNHALAGIV